MSLRIGYINVRGLSKAAWDACHDLLNTEFDFLFVAETWFVAHELRTMDRRVIAWTTESRVNLLGRPKGGIYLMGSQQARSKMAKKAQRTEHTITFQYGKHTITGVYFPPSLEPRAIASLLTTLKTSTVIMGDINVRFRDLTFQSGEPSTIERRQLYTDFMDATHHIHLKPERSTLKLTTDHCFVQASQFATLKLLPNAKSKIGTDHEYTLSLILGQGTSKQSPEQDIKRFRISQLTKECHREALLDLISRSRCPFSVTDTIEGINAKLVHFCQHVQEKTIGLAGPSTARTPQGTRPTTREQTVLASIRLYKHASQVSKENDVIFPTLEAMSQGIDVTSENLSILKERWTGQVFQPPCRTDYSEELIWWTTDQVIEEIKKQEAEKCCGADGIHIRFLKVVQETPIMTWLQQLYNRCCREGVTPEAWNESEIYLLTKDPTKRRDAKNVRPISIICIFRKVFERLLLLQVQDQPWAQLHPGQAGFRRSYSTYSNAAVVHALLSSRSRSTAVFLDFKSAFDVVDHQRLDAKLETRGCPATVRLLLQNLMFLNLRSRILINEKVTSWFRRLRGVLQGSPLSPWLFNLFVDDLLHQVNAQSPRMPLCLFYADDGAIIADSRTDLAGVIRMVEEWTVENAMFLNPTKCAVITTRSSFEPLMVYGQAIPSAVTYTYLGFPVTATGIDFATHLETRVQAAIGRAAFLGTQSDPWGPAHRLRVYKQFLAPMFEYGAPIVWAWAQDHLQEFLHAIAGVKALMGWISNTSGSRHLVTANLCGLPSLTGRFQHLSTAYHGILEQMSRDSPLRQLENLLNPASPHWTFTKRFFYDKSYQIFKETSNFQPTVPAAFSRFRKEEQTFTIQREALGSHVTALIPIKSRQDTGLFLADICLSAPISIQGMLLQYRRGVFMQNYTCACDPQTRFRRGHEDCKALACSTRLSRVEQQQKREMKSELGLSQTKFTNIDFLLNIGAVNRAGEILRGIKRQLWEIYLEKEELEKERLKDLESHRT
jgi:hypothetical protein